MTTLLKSLARRPRRIGTFGSCQIHQMNFTNCLMWKTIHKSSFGKGHCEDGVARRRGFKWLKPAKNKFTWCDFTNFYKSISADLHHFRFRWLIPSCILKICQIAASISVTSQFHKFSYLIFGRFLLFETCARRCRSCWLRLWCGWRSPAPWGSWSRRSPSPGVYLNFAHRARLWDVHVPKNLKRLKFDFNFFELLY